MTRIAICGIRGRMGSALVRLAADRADVDVVGGIGHAADGDAPPAVALDNAASVIAQADVVLDFSAADVTQALLERASEAMAGRALIVGTTGLGAATRQRLDELARHTAVLTAANFSVGVNLLLGMVERMARALDHADYDIEIIEAHHRRKTDAPSGTAIALGQAAARGRAVRLDEVRRDGRRGDAGARKSGEIGLHAVRGGGITGEHRVLFAGELEVIELRHDALDRAVFAHGALEAARWIAGRRAGRYTMNDVLAL